MRRVAITGIGAVSALGLTADEAYDKACAGHCGIGPLTIAGREAYPHRLRESIAGQINDFDPGGGVNANQAALYDRSCEFCMVAARAAVADSGLVFDGALAGRTAVVTGTGIGGIGSIDDNAWRLYFEQRPRAHPLSVPRNMPSASASHVSIAFGIRGPVFTVSSACASAAHAIGEAYMMIKHGRADVAVAGGTEAPLTLGTVTAWHALRVMSNDGCRPFSKHRNGMVLGEGAGIVVLEAMEAAKARGARIHGELAGYGLSADAASIVEPSAEGCAAAIRQCLEDAALAPEAIGYINAHGTGTRANDETESGALRSVLGAALDGIWVSSTKSMHGHALGASPAIEFVLALQALNHGVLPPTIKLDDPDPACDLRHVRNTAVEAPIEAIMSNSFAFGGLNAVLAARRLA